MKQQQTSFTEGKILSKLILFALPVLLAIFLQTMYGAADLLIVGQFSTAAEVSAVSTGSWIMQTITTAISGLAMGTTIFIGQKVGEKNEKETGKIIGASIYLFIIIGIILTILLLLLAPAIARIMQSPEAAFDSTVAYIRICSAGAIFIVSYNVLGSIFRGLGDSKTPFITVAIACVTNIVGDYILVGMFDLAAAGAAIATVFAQFLSVVLSILIIAKKLPFELKKEDIYFNKPIIKHIVKRGFPLAFQDTLVGISFLVITAIANSLGVIASAGVGVAEKICGFILLVPSAYMQSMSAFVAQNIGASQYKRAKKALLYGVLTSLFVGIIMAYFTFFHGDILAGFFAKDAEVVLAATDYLKAYAFDCILLSFLFCFIGYFNGCNKTTFVMIQGITGAFLVRIPISYFMSKVIPVSLFKIGMATPISSAVQIILCFGYFIMLEYKTKHHKDNKHLYL